MKQIYDITKVPLEELRFRGAGDGFEIVAIYSHGDNNLLVIYKHNLTTTHQAIIVNKNGRYCPERRSFASSWDILHCPPFEFPSGVGEALRYCMDGGAFKARDGEKVIVYGDYRIAGHDRRGFPLTCRKSHTIHAEYYTDGKYVKQGESDHDIIDFWDEERDG